MSVINCASKWDSLCKMDNFLEGKTAKTHLRSNREFV